MIDSRRSGRWAAMGLLPWLVVVVTAFGVAVEGYSQWRYPVALLGAREVPYAAAFNVLGFILPGLLAAFAALAVFGAAPAGQPWRHRIGVQLLFLSGLAFAGLGLFPLDPSDLEGPATQWHSSAWLLWEVAFIPAMLALGAGAWARDRTLGLLCFGAAAVVLLTGFVPLLPAPLAQRLGFAAWAAWFGLAAPRVSGRA